MQKIIEKSSQKPPKIHPKSIQNRQNSLPNTPLNEAAPQKSQKNEQIAKIGEKVAQEAQVERPRRDARPCPFPSGNTLPEDLPRWAVPQGNPRAL